MNLHILIIQVGTGIIVITFLVALLFRKKEKPGYFKYIFLFVLCGLGLSLNTFYSNYYAWLANFKIGILIEEILLTIQSIFLGLFYFSLLRNSGFGFNIRLAIIISAILQLSVIAFVHIAKIEIRQNILASSTTLILSLFYFKDLMSNKPTVILKWSPSFWMVMGSFFSSCITIPILSLIPFLPKESEYSDIRNLLFAFNNISFATQYLLIIKSYLCLRHQQNF